MYITQAIPCFLGQKSKSKNFGDPVGTPSAKISCIQRPKGVAGQKNRKINDDDIRQKIERSLEYMGLKGGQKISDVEINTVFIGSCTNSRIEDLRSAAEVIKGKKVKEGIRAMIVPGSGLVKTQAEEEGLNVMFIEAGFEWREPGCSMCLAMNEDKLQPGERCASTSNRNFEGRQGKGGRTHLVSPEIAAASAITGKLTDAGSII